MDFNIRALRRFAAGALRKRSALLRAGLYRQAALDPPRAGGAAGHAFLDVIDLGETDALQILLYLRGAIAGAADQRDGRIAVALHFAQGRSMKSR